MTMFTTLTPCVVCCAQIVNRANFDTVVIGDITNAPTTEPILRAGGITNVITLEDAKAIALYKEYSEKRPDLHFIDWGGHKKFEEALAARGGEEAAVTKIVPFAGSKLRRRQSPRGVCLA